MEKPFRQKMKDQEVLEKRKKKLKESDIILSEGVYIRGEIKEFTRKSIMKLFTIMLPNDFFPMPQEYISVKYPSTFRPQRILTTADLKVNMGFNVFPRNSKDIESMTNEIKAVLKKEQAGLNFSACEKLENSKSYWFSFRNHAADNDVYNMMLIAGINQQILQITFNCPMSEQVEWKQIILQMWESIERLKESA